MITKRRIEYQELPIEAQDLIDDQQKSYIDEFQFFYDNISHRIEAWYAGELLATYDGYGWM